MYKQSKRRTWLVLIMVFFCLLLSSITISVIVKLLTHRNSIRYWEPAVQIHSVSPSPQFEEVWSLPAFIGCLQCLTANENYVYFVGSLTNNSPVSVIQVDSATGQVKRESLLDRQRVSSLSINSSIVYIGLNSTQKIASERQMFGTAQVTAFDQGLHREIWSRKIPGSTEAFIVQTTENAISIFDDYGQLYQLSAKTGQRTILDDGFAIFEDSTTRYFLETPYVLSAMDIMTGDTLWESNFDMFLPPLFNSGVLVMRTGENIGEAIGVDGLTGETIWEYHSVVSNVIVANSAAYFLVVGTGPWGVDAVQEAQLLVVDIGTGSLVGDLSFEPSEIRANYGNYEYIVSVHNNNIYVYLGDGRQLFCLRFLDNGQ